VVEVRAFRLKAGLSYHCQTELENDHDRVRVETGDDAQIIQELKAAGFEVLRQR
jgi:hypothetical protein